MAALLARQVATNEPPTQMPPRSWSLTLSLTMLGLFSAWFGPIQVLLGLQASQVAPGHKEATLSLVTGLGALVSTLGNPVFGALSDRTTSRFGRRLPWIAGGLALGAVGLVVLASARGVAGMVVGWCLVQAFLNATFAALNASIADQVPVERRGLVSGLIGVAQTAGLVAGAGLAAAVGSTRTGYLVLAVLVVALGLPHVLGARDLRLPDGAPRPTLRHVMAGFVPPLRRYPDFGWAWLTRFLVNLGNSTGTLYLLYYLMDAVGMEADKATTGVFILTGIYALTVFGSTVIGGVWSDKVGRRKPFVIAASIVTGLASLDLALTQNWVGAVVGAVILGIGFGAFTSVDFALVTQVLPSSGDAARDLGIINIASAGAQVLAPVLAAPVVTHLGGYTTLYVMAAVVCLLGAACVLRIRTVA
ncbi:MFS transporter [Actinomyces urogenitalis]|uniref:MFS transporter n=1 Tax=Actinomyces urogenitalis TaxID=103621 RepID=UPI0028FFA96C|nr:MFS transporter [Actinomyces urogenitalis]MDU0863969.1 MFS transporter [Actinomyces urogenitalis]MDU0874696.1 MFS transporter [Actinomyces urogenitalis]MDU1564354.1 MFS transporter [Actinomyces urogenitalis]MDU1639670.1 MFS transporter [Actinomyces urogenitalis]MDU6777477.1 MFS transporter [Actinomyces urogenitalis]